MSRDWMLCGDEDDEENKIDGVVVWAGGVRLPSFGASSVEGRRAAFWLIKPVNLRVIDDFLDEEDGIVAPDARRGTKGNL